MTMTTKSAWIASAWIERAACRDRGALFALSERSTRTERKAQADAALAICQRCPVIDDCREFASRHSWCMTVIAGVAIPLAHPITIPAYENRVRVERLQREQSRARKQSQNHRDCDEGGTAQQAQRDYLDDGRPAWWALAASGEG